jgi:hypothetical protein
VSGFCRGFGVVGYGKKKEHLRAVAIAGAVAAAALSEPGIDWKQYSEMFLEYEKYSEMTHIRP